MPVSVMEYALLKISCNLKVDVFEMSKDELNIIGMGQLIGDVTTDMRYVPKEQSMPASTFSRHGVKVCTMKNKTESMNSCLNRFARKCFYSFME